MAGVVLRTSRDIGTVQDMNREQAEVNWSGRKSQKLRGTEGGVKFATSQSGRLPHHLRLHGAEEKGAGGIWQAEWWSSPTALVDLC